MEGDRCCDCRVKRGKECGVRLHLVIAGEGPERENLCSNRASMVFRMVCFLGNQSHRQILSLMKSCLLFVLASRAEGMPLVIAEAMACGRAVVATQMCERYSGNCPGCTTGSWSRERPSSLASALLSLFK